MPVAKMTVVFDSGWGYGIAWLVAYLALVSLGFSPYLTDEHGFRQTQTAMVARYIGGWVDVFFNQLPVFGPPWELPFEFPLYQALAKLLSTASPLSLESSGRVISIAFFLLCLWRLHRILRKIGVANTSMVLAAVALAPLYVVWSRAFMIETAALFFTLWYVDEYLRQAKNVNLSKPQATTLFVAGVAAALVKITTFLPFILISIIAQAALVVRRLRAKSAVAGTVWLLAVQLGALGVGAVWVMHADAVREKSPFGPLLTSKALQAWNWGTLGQRADPAVWQQLSERTIAIFFPLGGVGSATRVWLLACFATILFAYFLFQCKTRRRLLVASLLGLYCIPFLLFINLHYIHNYYQVANGFLLCTGVGLAAEGALSAAAHGAAKVRIHALFAAFLLLEILIGARFMLAKASHPPPLLTISQMVRDASRDGSVVVIAGQDWSSVIPYQSQRRALMLWGTPEIVRAALLDAKNAGVEISLYLSCGAKPEHDSIFRDVWHFDAHQPLKQADGCLLFQL